MGFNPFFITHNIHTRILESHCQEEKIIRHREEKEAQVTKDPSIATSSDIDKGKSPMEDIPQASIDQQVKSLIHTSEQIK